MFAVAALAVTLASSWVAYGRVRAALESELARRLQRVAETAASQIAPETVAGIRRAGEESPEYDEVQVQLVTLRSATGIADAALIDSLGVVLVEAGSPEGVEQLPARFAAEAGPAFARAMHGAAAVSPMYHRDQLLLRAAFVPVRVAGKPAAGVVAVEAEVGYLPLLAALARTLALIALISAIAISVLAALIVRAAAAGAALERRLTRLENLAAMGRLTATLAHEIKNPLAIIRGSAERLKSLEPEASRMATFVIEETDRLSKTVARYLQFARGGDEIHERGDAAAALAATLELLEGEFRERRVRLERAAGAPHAAEVALDNESLKQVYLNLILNALEAMPEGGVLGVTAVERQGRYEVAFSDSGPGIPPDILGKLGTPFYTNKAKGSGLGLFLTRRLLEAAGGGLHIQSEPGRGTTCTVRLPRGKG